MKHKDKIEVKHEINQAFLELQKEFPFGKGYLEQKRDQYFSVAANIIELCPRQAKLLSLGSGPCDLEAILSKLGFKITAIDDLNDQWHLIGNNRGRIIDFAERMGIQFSMQPFDTSQAEPCFDAVLLIDVIEHLHNSPRALLNYSLLSLKPNGLLIIETPNSVALRKRLWLLFGKRAHVNANFFYWNVGDFRGHVREYSPAELRQILSNHNLDVVKMEESTPLSDMAEGGVAFHVVKSVYKFTTTFSPHFKDTILIFAKKPIDWQPTEVSIKQFKKYYTQLENYNLDRESDEIIANKILQHSRHNK